MTRCSFKIARTAGPMVLQILIEDEQDVVAHLQIPVTDDDIKRLWHVVNVARPGRARP